MRNIIFGTVAGLLIGTAGALAYSHYLGDGSQLADLQSQLDAVNAKLAKADADQKFLKEQNNSETEQLNQVLANKQQQASGDTTQAAAAAPAAIPFTVGGIQITPDMISGFMGMMRGGPGGGFRSPEQRVFLLQTRLKLSDDQAKAIKDAMAADQKARRDAFRQARQNGQAMPDAQTLAAANTLDKTLATVLSPSQQVQYQQVESDEKQARAEVAATTQVDNLMPLLQLSDDQKEKMMTALYQQQLAAPDAAGLANNPNPLGALAQQGQAIQGAMKQVLSADQFALYQQDQQVQAQNMGNFGGGGGRNRGNGGNGGAGGQGQGQGQAAGGVASGNAPAAAPTAATGTTSDTGTATTNAASATPPDNGASTNSASATTNATSATPPAGT